MTTVLVNPPLKEINDLYLCDSVPNHISTWLASFYNITPSSQWELSWRDNCPQLKNKHSGLYLVIDFSVNKYKQRQKSKSKEVLLEAVKIKKEQPNHIIDATPGLLKDSLMLFRKGIAITAIERNPLLFIMVEHALEKSEIAINYIFGDSISALKNYIETIDVIYLDPMFPPRKKSAKVKQDMQILNGIVGKDTDVDKLMRAALDCNKRIVVKRPANEPPLTDKSPSHYLLSAKKMIRYDVYI